MHQDAAVGGAADGDVEGSVGGKACHLRGREIVGRGRGQGSAGEVGRAGWTDENIAFRADRHIVA